MAKERTHRAVASDGTAIVGRVQGQGPPLVLVHGSMADGESDWETLLPWLEHRFTCFLPSTRGRGRSEAHADLSNDTRVADLATFIETIGEPVAVMALSAGSTLALGAAARTTAVRALAVYEPVAVEAIDQGTRDQLERALDDMEAAAADGRPADAAERFFTVVANDEESALLKADPQALTAMARYLPLDLEEIRAMLTDQDEGPTAPSVLARISAPTLVLRGSRTALPWFAAGARHVAQHVPHASVCHVPDAGHLGPIVRPEAVAHELTPFLDRMAGT